MILYPPRRQRVRSCPALCTSASSNHWDPPTNSARIKGALSGSSRSQELKKVQQQYSGHFWFHISCLHSRMDLDFPLNPWKNHLKGNTKDLIEVIWKLMKNFIAEKVLEGGVTQFDSQQKNMPLSRWTRAFGWELNRYRRSTKPNPWLLWDNSDSTPVVFFRPWTVVAPMDRFSSQLVWCHSSSLISHMNGWQLVCTSAEILVKNASKILSSYHPPSTPPKKKMPYTPLSERKQCSGVSAEPGS